MVRVGGVRLACEHVCRTISSAPDNAVTSVWSALISSAPVARMNFVTKFVIVLHPLMRVAAIATAVTGSIIEGE